MFWTDSYFLRLNNTPENASCWCKFDLCWYSTNPCISPGVTLQVGNKVLLLIIQRSSLSYKVRIQAFSSEAQELNPIDDPGEELWYRIPSLISTLPSHHQVVETLNPCEHFTMLENSAPHRTENNDHLLSICLKEEEKVLQWVISISVLSAEGSMLPETNKCIPCLQMIPIIFNLKDFCILCWGFFGEWKEITLVFKK